MARVRAALLAAGRGVRMGGGTPKTLLHMGAGGPLVRYILDGLKAAGVDDLLVITGHRPEEIEDYVTQQWGEEGLSLVRNSRYASWGNFHSVRMAVDQSPGYDLLVVNSDIAINPEIYSRVISKPGELVLAVQRRQRLDQEDMRVQLEGDRVLAIGKDLHMARSHGEYCGVSMLRGDAHRAYADVATQWQWRGETSGYYEDVYNSIVGRVDARAAEVAAGDYAEVDTPEDVENAVSVIRRHFQPSPA